MNINFENTTIENTPDDRCGYRQMIVDIMKISGEYTLNEAGFVDAENDVYDAMMYEADTIHGVPIPAKLRRIYEVVSQRGLTPYDLVRR